jgi:hypothetical protein
MQQLSKLCRSDKFNQREIAGFRRRRSARPVRVSTALPNSWCSEKTTQNEVAQPCETPCDSEAGGGEPRKESETQDQLTTSEESKKRLEELEQQVAAFQTQFSEKHGASDTQRADLDASRSEVAALRKKAKRPRRAKNNSRNRGSSQKQHDP